MEQFPIEPSNDGRISLLRFLWSEGRRQSASQAHCIVESQRFERKAKSGEVLCRPNPHFRAEICRFFDGIMMDGWFTFRDSRYLFIVKLNVSNIFEFVLTILTGLRPSSAGQGENSAPHLRKICTWRDRFGALGRHLNHFWVILAAQDQRRELLLAQDQTLSSFERFATKRHFNQLQCLLSIRETTYYRSSITYL